MDERSGWLLLAVLNLPTYLLLGRMLFGNWAGFWEAVRYAFTPDIVSWFRGEGFNDGLAEFMLWIYLALCALAVWGEHWLLVHQLGMSLPY